MKHSRSYVVVPLAVACLLAVACGDLEQQSLEPTAADETVPALTSTPPAPTPMPTEAQLTATPAAPSATAVVAVEPTATPPIPLPQSLRPGDVAKAGGSYRVGSVAFQMPPGAELAITFTLNDPGGTILVLYDPASGSSLKLDPATGKELERYITESKWSVVFDFVAESAQLAP